MLLVHALNCLLGLEQSGLSFSEVHFGLFLEFETLGSFVVVLYFFFQCSFLLSNECLVLNLEPLDQLARLISLFVDFLFLLGKFS